MSITDLAIYNGGNIDFYIDNYKDIELQYDKHIIIVEEFTDEHKEKLDKYNNDKLQYRQHYLSGNNNIYIDEEQKKLIILINIENNKSLLNKINIDILVLFKELIIFLKKNKNNLFSINKEKYVKIYIDNYEIIVNIIKNILFEINIIIKNININNYNFLKEYNFNDIFQNIYNFIHNNIIDNIYKIDDTKKKLYEIDEINKIKTENSEYIKKLKQNEEEIKNNKNEIQLLKYKEKNINKEHKNTEEKYSKLIKIIGVALFITCIISLLFNIYTITIGRFSF